MHAFVAAAGRRRRLVPVLHLGRPCDEVVETAECEWYDAPARADLVTRALDGLRCPDPLAWLGRAGGLEPREADLRWLAAVRTGYQRHGLDLPGFFVVTRHGWADLVSDQVHPWARVRPARHAG